MGTLIVIAGPTASGKTQLAIDIATELQTEIVSCDSRQFYKEISIGTAKPTPEQLALVPHHFIGNISIKDEYSAGQYEKDAIELLDCLFKKYNFVVLTGGSGMYLDAVLEGFDELPNIDASLRDKLNQIYREEGLETLQVMLAKHDPEHYNNVDINNPQRIIRALEISLTTGKPYSDLRKRMYKERSFDVLLFAIDLDREELYGRINQRVDEMMLNGLLDEVQSMLPYRNLNALKTVGYTETLDYLDGNITIETAVNLIKQNTRRFAKRQMTWFRKYKEMVWIKPNSAKETILSKVK